MYELTIDVENDVHTTAFDDFPEAHQALMSQIVAQDLYLHPRRPATPNAPSFTLLRLEEGETRGPRVIGSATIEPTAAKPVIRQQKSAEDALRWTAEHTATWRHGSDTDRGVRYPLAVLAAARAEARYGVTAGHIFTEAARLSDASPDTPRPPQHSFERMRARAVAAARNSTITTGADLVESMKAEPDENFTAEQTAALIWYFALILWGAPAS